MKYERVLNTGTVMRYHSCDIDKKQSVAEHSWGVAVLACLRNPDITVDELKHALFHDCAEALMGDIPAPMKRIMSEESLQELDAMELEIIDVLGIPKISLTAAQYKEHKINDYMEGLWFCESRIAAGDTRAVPVRDTYLIYLGQLGWENDDEC